MVDFNAEATMSTPVPDLVKILILEARENVISAIEHYNKKNETGIETENEWVVVKARVISFFMQMEAMLHRRLPEKEYKDLYELVHSDGKKKILEAFDFMSKYLDKLGLWRIDLQRYYETSRKREVKRKSKTTTKI